MPFCGFTDGFGMFDVTPVENLFIEEYMMRAPGDYVKVYLYGLRMCYHPNTRQGLEGFARALGMEEGLVRDAFAYWEKQGIVRRMSDNPPSYAYSNLKAMLLNRGAPEEAQLYQYRDFNNALQALFGARLLHPADYARASEWIEELRMSEEAVLLMVRHAIDTRGGKVSFSYMDKMAVTWAKQGLQTKEAAQEYLRTQSGNYDGAVKLLRAMGLKRAPTVAEEGLYAKWRGDWELSPEQILAALGEMTKISNPNFAYIDKVLESARNRPAYTAAQREQAREVLRALGIAGAPTEDLLQMYTQWLSQGFDAEAVLLAARHTKRRGGKSFQQLEEMLGRYRERGLLTGTDIAAYMDALGRERQAAQAVKARTGDEGELTAQDISCYREMEKSGLGTDLLLLAAEYARGKQAPMAFPAKIVQNWQTAGICTLEEAVAEHEGRIAARAEAAAPQSAPSSPAAAQGPARTPFKRVSAQQFTQREYSDQEMGALLLDIDGLGEDTP